MHRTAQFLFSPLLLALAACGGGGAGIGATNPSGNIVVTMAGASAPLSTSSTAPQLVTSTGFAVTIHEDKYPSGFNARVLSYTSPTTAPCWAISVDQSHDPNVATFTPNGVSCPSHGDLEAVSFVDERGNTVIQYFRTQ